jgi:hypothetical protein
MPNRATRAVAVCFRSPSTCRFPGLPLLACFVVVVLLLLVFFGLTSRGVLGGTLEHQSVLDNSHCRSSCQTSHHVMSHERAGSLIEEGEQERVVCRYVGKYVHVTIVSLVMMFLVVFALANSTRGTEFGRARLAGWLDAFYLVRCFTPAVVEASCSELLGRRRGR